MPHILSKIGSSIRNIGLIGMGAFIAYTGYFWLMLNYASIEGLPWDFGVTTAKMFQTGLVPMYQLFLVMTAQAVAGEIIKFIGEVKEITSEV